MSDEKENNPTFRLKDIVMYKTAKIKLDCEKAIATGTNTYGEWNLWVGFVENQKVWEGRGKDAKPVENYTGKVIFFPTDWQNKELEKLADGNTEVEIKITKELDESRKFPIVYKLEKLSEGKPSQSSLTPGELKLTNDLQELINDGYDVSEKDIIDVSKEEKYGGNIHEERAKELFKMLK